MDERDFSRQIGLAWSSVKDALAIGKFLIAKRSLPVDDAFRAVALNEEATYEEIYKVGLSRSHYNILLSDYAYFQFTLQSPTSWRLGYFPNPWLTGAPAAEVELKHWETLEEIGALNHEEASSLIGDMPVRGAVPPIRFEYAPAEYQELAHPAAHFHIGRHSENRWASSLAVGPLAFTLHIAKMYYPTAWARCSRFYGAADGNCIDEMFLGVVNDVRIVHEFSEKERRAMHFGKNPPARWWEAFARPRT